MKHEAIGRLIDALNAGWMLEEGEPMSLSELVTFAYVQLTKAYTGADNSQPYPFYLIRGQQGEYVAAVLDMGYDLHVFVKPEHRKQGHLCNALNKTILPHLYQKKRTLQEVTFEDPQVAEYFIRRMDFQRTGPLSAEKDLSVFASARRIGHSWSGKSHERFVERHIDKSERHLLRVVKQFDRVFGKARGDALKELAAEIDTIHLKLSRFMKHQATIAVDPLFD